MHRKYDSKNRNYSDMGFIQSLAAAELDPRLAPLSPNHYKPLKEAQVVINKQKKQLDATYLASLARLQPAAAADPALASQIDEEKKRVISGNFSPITNLQTQIGGTKWQSFSDPAHFEFFTTDGRYSHWHYRSTDSTRTQFRGGAELEELEELVGHDAYPKFLMKGL